METPHDAAPADVAADAPARAKRARNLVVGGALACIFGIGLAGSVSRGVGGVLTAIGWIVLVGGIHTFGRLGTSPVR